MAMKYVGAGAFIQTVPARDLTDEEERQHAELIKQQETITGLKLYRKIAKTKAAKAAGGEA